MPDSWLSEAYDHYGSLATDLNELDSLDASSGEEESLDDLASDSSPSPKPKDSDDLASWHLDLYLIGFLLENPELSIEELASGLGTSDVANPYAATTKVLRRRNRDFGLVRERVESTIGGLLGPPPVPPRGSFVEAMAQRYRYASKFGALLDSAKRSFLLSGSL